MFASSESAVVVYSLGAEMPSKKKRTAKKQVTRMRSVPQAEPADLRKLTNEKLDRLVREMEIRQVELQLQNEQLRRAEMELNKVAEHYSILYEHAPIGYVTLDQDGKILEGNLTAANMLGIERQALLGSNLSNFITHEDSGAWYLHRRAAFSNKTKLACEIEMRRVDGTPLPVRIEGLFGPGKDLRCRTALIDITHRKDAEQTIRDHARTLEELVVEQRAEIRLQVNARKQTEQELDKYKKNLKTLTAELMLAEERERQRLAEDVHDGLGQALFRARMKLAQFSAAEPAVREIGTILEEISKMMNTMTFALSPPVLRKVGLRAALKSLAREMRQQYCLSVAIEDDGQGIPLEERTALILFRSVRELLINVAKHAQTDRANLSLQRIDDTVQIKVEDRGQGFDLVDQPSHVESGHFGLFSIRERMDYVGGTSTIRSSPGDGAVVTLTAPLSSAKAAGSS